jgi:mannonate dehydratase
MKRREFGRQLAGVAFGAAALGKANVEAASARVPRKNTRMHVGGDYHSVAGPRGADITGKENLEYNLRHGVKHLTATVKASTPDGAWDLDALKRMKDNCDRCGVTFEAIRMDADYITLRKGPQRERKIQTIIDNLRKASQVEVRIITYHWTVIPIQRNRQVAGRGGATYAGFKLEDNWRELPVGPAGRVTSEDYWERITCFLENVIPAAREHNVNMACHPYDPPGLPFGYRGADNWDSPSLFDALKRYESIVDSPHNGFQLCLGTIAEGAKKNPADEVLPVVEHLAARGKIHQVHMRNIRGRLHDFAEVFPDEGDVDFFKVLRVLRDFQFSGSLCPDHMPSHPDDPGRLQAFAFGYGYIRALIQAVNSEV